MVGLGGCPDGFTTAFFGFFFSLPRASRLPILCSSLSSLVYAGSLRWPKPLRQFTVERFGNPMFRRTGSRADKKLSLRVHPYSSSLHPYRNQSGPSFAQGCVTIPAVHNPTN